MNFDFAEKINPYLEKLDFQKAISIGEAELQKIAKTDFHSIIGKGLTQHADSLADWVDNFCKAAKNKLDIKSIYFEMNEFDINTDTWYIDSFAYNHDGGLDPDDMDWLSDFDIYSQTETETDFQIRGFEQLQTAFETVEPDTDELQEARDWCEQLIIARFMELMRAAHLIANQKGYSWAIIPIYFTEHSYDFVVRSEN